MGEPGGKMSLEDLVIDDRIILKLTVCHRMNTIQISHSRVALKTSNLLTARLAR
jgi:hypothetical protein